ncbi:vWA domain-containing protein [Rhodococcus marinonascens]|uniref:vWA domain-containing protein n=1 Tax=Rhodococcus marinonascens TaxID=38311 RepID=UPI000A5533E3|nr:VWA domain-containing protein [Rhodococcus marinonascens]
MSQQLSKGQNAPLSGTEVMVSVSVSAPADLSALLVTEAGTVRSDNDFIFYNQPSGPGVSLQASLPGQPANLLVSLADVPADIAEVRAIITLADATSRFGLYAPPITQLRDPAGDVLFEYRIDGLDSESIVIALDLYRRQGIWKVRAVGQGYAGGFAALVTDHGVTVDDAPTPTPVVTGAAPTMTAPPVGHRAGNGATAGIHPSPPSQQQLTPSPAAVQSAQPSLDLLPIDMRKRLDLRKRQVAVSLKKHGGDKLKARVVLVLDASGSMTKLYNKGIVTDVVERMAAVAAQLDDDGTMQAFIFATNSARLPDLEISDLPEWTRLHVRVGEMNRVGEMKLFGRSKNKLVPRQLDMGDIGFLNEEQKVIADVRAMVRADPQPVPTLVLFFSDGGVYRNREIEEQLRDAVSEPIFWQFVGLGRAGFGVLEKFDTLPGRLVDNVGFFSVDKIETIPDKKLYDSLLSEFPSWVKDARKHGILF